MPASLKKYKFDSENMMITQFCYDLAVKLTSLLYAYAFILQSTDVKQIHTHVNIH
jgi:hypothetical protein